MGNLRWLCFVLLGACTTEPNGVTVQLAPEVISSIDGTLAVHAIAFADRAPVEAEAIDVTIDYTDRNGTAHMIAPVSGKSDKTGAFDATFTGLTWDGTGTVKVSMGGGKAEADASFAVLDRTPPKVSIAPPQTAKIGTDVTVQVHVSDEIGVSQVWFEWNGNQGRQRSTVVASGSTDATIGFDFTVPDNIPAGTVITLYALAADLSGNEAAAMPVTVMATL